MNTFDVLQQRSLNSKFLHYSIANSSNSENENQVPNTILPSPPTSVSLTHYFSPGMDVYNVQCTLYMFNKIISFHNFLFNTYVGHSISAHTVITPYHLGFGHQGFFANPK